MANWRKALTYQQVVEQSDAVASRLIAEGIEREDIVGVLFERGCNMLKFAILDCDEKAGAAFLPLDPAYPQERLNFMVQDSGARVLVHDDLSEQLAIDIANQAKTIGYDSLDLATALLISLPSCQTNYGIYDLYVRFYR